MSSEARKIGWIGCGVMGSQMASHLLAKGHDVVVYTRTRERAEPLLTRGARWAGSPREAAEGRDVVISIVGYPADVEEVHLGPEGTLRADQRPRTIVDMTTSQPALAQRIAARALDVGVGSLDAPVSGGDIGARNATLSIMVGGDAAHFEAVRPLFEVMGKHVHLQGDAGAGQHTKMTNQILIATNMIGVCEALLYAQRAGLDPVKVLDSVAAGAAGSWSLSNLGTRMLRRDFAPGFYVKHFLKDLGIAIDEAQRMNLALPGLALSRQLYTAVRGLGHGRSGTQALLIALETLNNYSIEARDVTA